MSEKARNIFRQFLVILLGSAVGAFAIESIMLPNGLTTGGITGIGRMLQEYTGLDYSLIYYALSMCVVIIVGFTIGKKEVKKIIFVSIMYPTMMFIFERININLLDSNDMLLSAIFFGVLYGLSNGILFYNGYSTGGTDSLAKVIKYKALPYVGLSRILFMIDFIVIIVSGVVFGTNVALYAIITMYVSMKMTDAVMYGFAIKIVELSIITQKDKELTDYVMHDLGRGVTSVDIIGEYTQEHKKQLRILCSPREGFLIKRFLSENDKKSFVSVMKVSSVWGIGKGFSDINDLEN